MIAYLLSFLMSVVTAALDDSLGVRQAPRDILSLACVTSFLLALSPESALVMWQWGL